MEPFNIDHWLKKETDKFIECIEMCEWSVYVYRDISLYEECIHDACKIVQIAINYLIDIIYSNLDFLTFIMKKNQQRLVRWIVDN